MQRGLIGSKGYWALTTGLLGGFTTYSAFVAETMFLLERRSFGSALLHASLQELAQHELVEARGITRGNSIAARFVYSKFGGVMSDAAAPALVSEVIKKK